MKTPPDDTDGTDGTDGADGMDAIDEDSDSVDLDPPSIDTSPPPEVDADTFAAWRHPRPGTANPEPMDNPVWAWLIRVGINAWAANQHFGLSSFGSPPTWCFQRFGQSCTPLPDGREVLIAGEHEDYYDPDFNIYADVVVRHPDGRLQIFGYPEDVFPPTDFHSATLVGGEIVIIGTVGYVHQRTPGVTPVRILDLATFAIRTVETSGTPPSWIHRHAAELSGRRVIIRKGQTLAPDGEDLVENIDDWCLDLDDWRWHRLTHRQWPRRAIGRADGERNHLWEYRMAAWDRERGDHGDAEKLAEKLGTTPDFDAYAALYQPPVPFEPVEDTDDDSWNTVRLRIAGVIVRYVDEMGEVRLTVEGDLDPATVDALTEDFRAKLARLEGAPCVCRAL